MPNVFARTSSVVIATMLMFILSSPQLAHAAPAAVNPDENSVMALFTKPYGFSTWTIKNSSQSESWLSIRDRRRLDDTVDMIQVDIHSAAGMDDDAIVALVQDRLEKTERSCKRGGNQISWQPIEDEHVIASDMYVCEQDEYKGPTIFRKVGVGVAVWAVREGNSVIVFQYVGFRPSFENNDVVRISSQMAYRSNKVRPIHAVAQLEKVASNTVNVASN
jgi:hypothetical protein